MTKYKVFPLYSAAIQKEIDTEEIQLTWVHYLVNAPIIKDMAEQENIGFLAWGTHEPENNVFHVQRLAAGEDKSLIYYIFVEVAPTDEDYTVREEEINWSYCLDLILLRCDKGDIVRLLKGIHTFLDLKKAQTHKVKEAVNIVWNLLQEV